MRLETTRWRHHASRSPSHQCIPGRMNWQVCTSQKFEIGHGSIWCLSPTKKGVILTDLHEWGLGCYSLSSCRSTDRNISQYALTVHSVLNCMDLMPYLMRFLCTEILAILVSGICSMLGWDQCIYREAWAWPCDLVTCQGQKMILEHWGHVAMYDIRGMRAPSLAVGGDDQLNGMERSGVTLCFYFMLHYWPSYAMHLRPS